MSERLANYLLRYDQLNGFTLSLFSSNVTCLRRFVINVKYLSQFQYHILNRQPNIIELEIIVNDSNSNHITNMMNDIFYQRICPSIYSAFDEIYRIYSPFIVHHKCSRSLLGSRLTSISNNFLFRYLPHSSDEFSHNKLLNGILSNLHSGTIERLKLLNLSHYQFFAASYSTVMRRYTFVDMLPLIKW